MAKRFVTIFAAGLLLVGVWQFENIYEWWFLKNYDPPRAIVALANNAGMNNTGKRAFYLTDPEIDDKASFSQHCPVGEKSLVLGCYTGHIYILKVDRAQLKKVMDVTAAHEMLHAAYADLSSSERKQVDGWVESSYRSVDNKKLQDLVAEYEKTEPGERLNELHSLLGTQIADLSPELEDYYRRYFVDRQKVVRAYQSYEAVFTNLESQIKALKSELTSMRDQLDVLDQQIKTARAELDKTNSQLDAYRRSGNVQAYNQLVPTQNQQVNRYNNLVTQYRSLVASYNAKVDQINRIALEQNQLVESLDSTKFKPIQ